MKTLASVLLLLGVAAAQVIPSGGGLPTSSIVGQITTSTGGPVKNGTLTFSLSQPAIAAGTSTVVTQATACYTASSGNIVGIPDPIALPVVTTNTATGTLPSGTYFVQTYYVDATSHISALSPETAVVLSSTGHINVNAPLLQPSAAVGYGIAISTTSGTETIQGSVTGWTQYQQATPLVVGSTPIASNNSSCYVWFSDALIPTGTYYTVSLANKNGSLIAGFPQTWCTYGGATGTIDVSQGAPTGNCNTKGVFYPTPIFSNPSSLAQSISGKLNLSGALASTASIGLVVPGVFTNSQMNTYVTSQIGPQSAGSLFSSTQGGNFATDALTGIVTAPIGATAHQFNGINADCVTNAVSSPLGTVANCVSLYGDTRLNANNTAGWGQNVVVDLASGTTGTLAIGTEVDMNMPSGTAPNRFQGYFLTGIPLTGTMPTGPTMGTIPGSSNAAFGYGASFPASSTTQFPVMYYSSRGSAAVGLMLDAACYAGACNSQVIQLGSNNGTTAKVATIQADQIGDVTIGSSVVGAGVQFPTAPFASLNPSGLNGTKLFCTDCKNVVDNAVTAGAACVGSGAGAYAKRENNRWDCN